MSQPLETAADFIGEEEDVAEEEVECKLPLEEMRMLKEEQEELDGTYPAVDAVSRVERLMILTMLATYCLN